MLHGNGCHTGRTLGHLVNFRPERPVRDVQVRVQLPGGKSAGRVVLASPEHADSPVTFKQQGDAVTFTVPEVGTYEIAVMDLQKQ